MSLAPVLDALLAGPLSEVTDLRRVTGTVRALDSLRAPIVAALADAERPTLVITPTRREAERVLTDLGAWAPDALALEFPAWETLPHERLSPSAETVGQRFAALQAVTAGEGRRVLVASVRAASQPVSARIASVEPVTLTAGGRGYDVEQLTARLVELAYSRVDMVTRRGEFALRGGILDVFSPAADQPVRAEFFGDELEQLRWFSVADQRSSGDADAVVLPPARELLLTDDVRARAKQLALEFPALEGMLAKLTEGIAVEGMESLAPLLVDDLVALPSLLGDPRIIVLGPERCRDRIEHLNATNHEFLMAAWNAATAGAEVPVDVNTGEFVALDRLTAGSTAPRCDVTALPNDLAGVLDIPAQAVPQFPGGPDGAVEFIRARLADGWSLLLTAHGQGMVDRAADVLAEREVAARATGEDAAAALAEQVAVVAKAPLEAGFLFDDAKVGVISEAELFGKAVTQTARSGKQTAKRRGSIVDPLALKPGDYVVHETHGVGRFVELVQRTVKPGRGLPPTTREYLVIEYAPSKRGHPGDKLSVPTDQLDLLTRYVGGDAPTLSKMGGSDWQATKSRARKAVREIAVELVQLYSARKATAGFAFSPDTPWQRELEDAFPFAETPDQLTTIDEVKRDMEAPIPMDRLLSGDVGYGKTEVAVRAAFKAVQDSKQVAMLVPTTLLVKQHLSTFQERFAGFPVTVRPLSRFQTDKEAKETIAGLADGSVDVVIGTHRILTDGVQFKDLGLVIIDEEQRFGVEHKDALKKLKTNVDLLAMSATPIPRTLEMAVTGIREMSNLQTPPEARHPVLTYVGARNDEQLAAAIRRELLREGQVFFVHNRVSTINRQAATLAELVPEARIGVAHGRMSEATLEAVIDDFWEKRLDVLVCTTIVETGLDIPNANTLIVDHAERYGLSQLHQLRGRVGRGRERAYAYFVYDPDKPLSETAHDRLETIAVHNELGAGMQVAMKDLEIRGAGNLLGGEQSGHIAGVGFDLYLRMIGEAVATFRGASEDAPRELRLELPVDAVVPEDYIDSERLRLEAYQKLAQAAASQDEGAIERVAEEWRDRYGEPPKPVENLLAMARLRRQVSRAGLSEVFVMGPNLRIAPAKLERDSEQLRLRRLYPEAMYQAQQGVLVHPLPTKGGGRLAGTRAEPLPDAELIAWVGGLVADLWPEPAAEAGADA